MINVVNVERVRKFAKEKCICMDYVFCDGIHYDDPELVRKRLDYKNQYGYNAGIVAFVIDGHYYATPFVEEAFVVLETANIHNTGIDVPFGGLLQFPFKLGGKDLIKLYRKSRNPRTGNCEAASQLVKYYNTLLATNGTFRTWDRLLQESGYLKPGDTLAKRVMDMIVMPVKNATMEYNQEAERFLKDYEDKDIGSSGSGYRRI